MRQGYDLILTWSSFASGENDERIAGAVATRQKPGGLLLQFHDEADPNRLAFALHQYRLLATRTYACSAGREPKAASAWGWA